MSGIREVKASGRRKGYAAKFFERGGKFRLDFLEMNESEKEKLKEKLGVHFSVLLKIVFRGRGGGEKEKIQAILLTICGSRGRARTGNLEVNSFLLHH